MSIKKISAILTAVTVGAAALGIVPVPVGAPLTIDAAESYPVQKFRLALSDTDQNVNASGSSLIPSAQNGTVSEKWSVNFISSGVFEIVNSSNGQILTDITI